MRQDPISPDLADADLYEAMKDVQGYLDITLSDLKEIYRHAYRHAIERVYSSVLVRDIMTSPAVSVGRESPLKAVAEIMAQEGVAGVPVLEADGRVAGVISEKDFLALMGSRETKSFMALLAACLAGHSGCPAEPIRAQHAGDIMTSPAVTVRDDVSLREIEALFSERKINRVPVVDSSGRLIGIVSRADVIRSQQPTAVSRPLKR